MQSNDVDLSLSFVSTVNGVLASRRKISRPSACIFLRANRCLYNPRLCQATGNSSTSRAVQGLKARIPAAKLSREPPLQKELAFEIGKLSLSAFSVLTSREARRDFSFWAQRFFFSGRLLSGLREKGRHVHFPFLPNVLENEKLRTIVYTYYLVYLLIYYTLSCMIVQFVVSLIFTSEISENIMTNYTRLYDRLHEVRNLKYDRLHEVASLEYDKLHEVF